MAGGHTHSRLIKSARHKQSARNQLVGYSLNLRIRPSHLDFDERIWTGGWSKSGFEAAAEYHGLLQKLITDKFGEPVITDPAKDGDEEAKIRYEIMNAIPENWIPFIPAHVKDNNREVQLQRAAMPRILDGNPDQPDKIRPRTALLQVGLKDKDPYFIHEEEVPRAGIRVEQSFQRTRWNNGKVFVWFGVRKTTGRGEGSSGLGFDRIVAVKKSDKG